MIEKLTEPKIVKMTCFQISITDKINEIIDAVNALGPKCNHHYRVQIDENGKVTGEYRCEKCDNKLLCEHRWVRHATDETLKICAECGIQELKDNVL